MPSSQTLRCKLENFHWDVKRKTWILIGIVIISCTLAHAAFDVEPGDSRSLSLGGCLCADPDPLTAAIGNPAGLSQCRGLAFETGFEQLYNLPDLAVSRLALSHPLADGGIGLNLRSFGNDIYREIEAVVSISSSLGSRASLGASVGYHWLSIQKYGSDGDMSLSLGIQARPLSSLTWGLWGRNLNEGHIGVSNDPLPQETVTGISYRIAGKVLTLLDISKEPRYPETYKLGIEAELNSFLIARIGVQRQPNRAGGGFGVKWNAWRFDYGTNSHPELGWTHSVSLRWGIP